jgi:pyrimidine-specific ribonucleoside hydrolase
MNWCSIAVAVWLLMFCTSSLPAETSGAGSGPRPIPVIDVTDLYHPHQDVGDNFDLIAAYALPELDLRAVILDCTEPFRQPVAKDPGPGLFPDARGPREPGFIPVRQLNFVFGRNVPCATIPFDRMKSPGDGMLDAPPFQQQGIELMLKTLRESAEPVHIVSFGSARAIAVAYNREPQLFREKLGRLHLCAGGSSPPAPNYIEWNVALDPQAIVCLLRSNLPIALYPCAANNAGDKGYGVFSPAFSYDEHNTYWKLPDLLFLPQMDAPLRRYLEYAFSRSSRVDFLRALEVDGPPLGEALLAKEHKVWETAVWICLSGRKLVQRPDGSHRIIPADQVTASDKVLPNELRPCTVSVRDDGIYEFRETTQPTNFFVYYRGNPRENGAALSEALPALYLSFQTARSNVNQQTPARGRELDLQLLGATHQPVAASVVARRVHLAFLDNDQRTAGTGLLAVEQFGRTLFAAVVPVHFQCAARLRRGEVVGDDRPSRKAVAIVARRFRLDASPPRPDLLTRRRKVDRLLEHNPAFCETLRGRPASAAHPTRDSRPASWRCRPS